MEINKETIEKLWYFRTWCCDLDLFRKIYNDGGDVLSKHSLASHMWRKFENEANSDFLVFWRMNDVFNQCKILVYLESNEFEKKYKQNM